MKIINHYHRDDNEYAGVLKFSKENNNINYKEFDNHIINDLSLFNIPSDSYFSSIEKKLNKILSALPSMKRIFSRPTVYLKDKHEIVPVEAVKVVNNSTLSHVSYHTELWDNITEEGIKPRKLLTIEKKENYAIYENIIFSRVIKSVLAYLDEIILLIKDLLYDCQDLNFNILDRTHHKLYFLALGKLHIEYVLAHEKHFSKFSNFIETLLFIEKTIKQRLSSQVYKKCSKNKAKLKLKKTNIFRNHKDYKQIYELAKTLNLQVSGQSTDYISQGVSSEEYANYVNILLLFSLGHFNFTFNDEEKFDFLNLNNKCTYLNWNLSFKNISNDEYKGLLLTFRKDKEYNICLIYDNFEKTSDKHIDDFKKLYKADEYLVVSCEEYGKKGNVYISLYDIDSFRRIQQIILRGMIYSDDTFDVCPFCGNKLSNNKGVYECDVCRGQIIRRECVETHEIFYVTVLNSSILGKKAKEARNKHNHLKDRFSEAQYHFRNITSITADGKNICPRCGKIQDI